MTWKWGKKGQTRSFVSVIKPGVPSVRGKVPFRGNPDLLSVRSSPPRNFHSVQLAILTDLLAILPPTLLNFNEGPANELRPFPALKHPSLLDNVSNIRRSFVSFGRG
ncbi:Hypothetical protein NTJ_08332 [Nesidiocoris tenuis]|uniref:Uncharacterized protein n=1 Tax=Nesidiocoris tenuis TaxID=355587 RepID=A0ABN7AU14_9HEMI|nr:Hypothetical protein NTJ_08332 [Nesidiocoris tenuis]